jgi:hypothetical protein
LGTNLFLKMILLAYNIFRGGYIVIFIYMFTKYLSLIYCPSSFSLFPLYSLLRTISTG